MERRHRLHILGRGVFLLLTLALSGEAQARLLLSQKDALRLAFPEGVAIEKRTAYLGREQLAAAEKLASAKLDSAVWTYYEGRRDGAPAGWAYFDRVVIRTMPGTLMAALDSDGSLRFIEILTFDEPEDYLPMRRWLDLFKGKALDGDLRVKGGIRNIAGSTLSAYAIADSARRILALHQILHGGRRP